ncbi:acetyltransferase [Rhodobacteraceae bacterium PD-2]|nr:acetyltransferase [Rhodobacteraceae bacterium PD-2]
MTHRTATPGEVAQILDWAAQEGWNPGFEDAPAFHAADPGGFFLAETGGRPVAAISVVNHDAHHAFLGLYICHPDYRGQGIGLGLWHHALKHAGNRGIGLDGVPAQEANYAASGFVLTDRTRRLTGQFAPQEPSLHLARPQDMAALARLDEAATGLRRGAFLHVWLGDSATRKTVVLREGPEVTGFATARRCGTGCKIGPVIAPDPDTALRLARQAAAALDETLAILDVPDSRAAFGALLRRGGFTESFATARMYRGPAPQGNGTLMAVATLELG